MPGTSFALLESVLTSISFALVLASALGFAWRIYRQPYLGYWAGFWGLYVLVWSLYLAAYGPIPPEHRLAGTVALGLATFLSFAARALLALGIAAYLGWRPPRRREVVAGAAVLLALSIAGAAMRWLADDGVLPRVAVLPFRSYFLGGLLHVAAAIALLRGAVGHRSARVLLAIALLAGAASDGWDVAVELASGAGVLHGSEEVLRLSALVAHVVDALFAAGMMIAAIGTEHARAERAAAELRARDLQLQEAQRLETVGQLAGGLAHDFNNLLTAILGSLSFLRETTPPGSPAREDVDAASDAATRAAELTRQLLTFARRQPVAPGVVDVNACLGALRPVLQPLLSARIELRLRLAPGVLPVRADPGGLEQLVVNLVVNARDAMPDGGTVEVETRAIDVPGPDDLGEARGLAPGPWVRLSVEDEGVGMDEGTRSRIFEPFFTTKPVGRGTGLGLAVVHGIVRQGGGRVSVRSAPGEGTRFTVFLPRAAAVPAPAPGAAAAAPGAGRGGGDAVLLVDDDGLVRAAAARALRASGFEVLPAASAGDALAILEGGEAHRIAALVTDVVMPGTDGVALATAVRKVRPGLPVLFVSGYAPRLDRGDPLPGGAWARLGKPFTPEALAARVRSLIDEAAARERTA